MGPSSPQYSRAPPPNLRDPDARDLGQRLAHMSGIDYSKWDKLDLDSDDDESQARAPPAGNDETARQTADEKPGSPEEYKKNKY